MARRGCTRSTSTGAPSPTRWPTPSATASPTGVSGAVVDLYPWVPEVVEFSPLPFTPIFSQRSEQIRRVEELSDAYHLKFGDADVMVAYLLETRR